MTERTNVFNRKIERKEEKKRKTESFSLRIHFLKKEEGVLAFIKI